MNCVAVKKWSWKRERQVNGIACFLVHTRPLNYMLQHACILSLRTYACDVSDPLPVKKKVFMSWKPVEILNSDNKLPYSISRASHQGSGSRSIADTFVWLTLFHFSTSPIPTCVSDFCERVLHTPEQWLYLICYFDAIECRRNSRFNVLRLESSDFCNTLYNLFDLSSVSMLSVIHDIVFFVIT